MLDPRRLQVLREFAAEGTIARAAEQLALTPSAVSQHLSLLQRETGVELLRHEGRRLELTEAGRFLVERGDAVLQELAAIEAELAHAAGVRGTVRIAAFQTAARFLVLPLLESLERTYPDLAVELLELEAESAIPLLLRAQIDVVVAEEYPNAPRPRVAGLVRRDLRDDELLVAVPRDRSVPRRKAIKLSAVAHDDWVTAADGTSYAAMTIGLCRSIGGFEPKIRHRANDLQLMLDVVADRKCAAIVPAIGKAEGHPGVTVRPPAEGPFTRKIFALSRASDAARPATTAVLSALSA